MFLREMFFYITGIGFLALAKGKNILKGYSSPKPFDISEIERCIEYDMQVVELWLSHLRRYTHNTYALAGKNVLELGPGSDMGIGIYLLSHGCSKYNACDVNDLMKSTPDAFYAHLFEKLGRMDAQVDINFLKEQLKENKRGNPSRLNYVIRNDFDIVSAFGEATVDLVVSQAAFEHFDDIETTISQLSAVCKPGAVLVAEIDLKTHSRWIRDKDPNNIYRYTSDLYKVFWFRGIPNRVRPYQYKEAFERHGWVDISITPLETLDDGDDCHISVNRAFASNNNQMDYLSIVLCARKKVPSLEIGKKASKDNDFTQRL